MLPIRSPLPEQAIRAHALKNCLAIVSAVNQLVEHELGEAAQQRLLRSHDAVRRMAKLLNEELQPQHEARTPLSGKFVSSRQVFEAVRARVLDLAEAKHIRLEFALGAGGLHGDFEALTEALGNIVKNAIESSAAGNAVAVKCFDGVDGGQLWTIRDTGSGISSRVLAQLGKPFYSRRDGGSGLGIAVARDIFDDHGGLAHIESAPGWGTTVSIWLPLSPPS